MMRGVEKIVPLTLHLFALFGVLFIPFSFRTLQIQTHITESLFKNLIVSFAAFIDIDLANPAISSDSASLYVLTIILFIIAVFIALSSAFFPFRENFYARIILVIRLVTTFYLSVVMLKYGFDKMFKAQFYIPEPNILFTPLGLLDRDILYWSTMGISHSYNVFLGCLEVIPALCLLFRKTRIFGLFLLTGVLLHVVFINFAFDISVKLYSSFLLFLCLNLLAPSFRSILRFFILNKPAFLIPVSRKNLIESKRIYVLLKIALILFFLFESLFPYVQTGHYNDDLIPRSQLHGAYEVVKVENGNGNPVDFKVKRVFFHRHNYFILQYDDDTMEDFHFTINTDQDQIILRNYDGEIRTAEFSYLKTTGTLKIYFTELDLALHTKSISWRELPLFQPLFHWTVDEI